MPDAETPPPGYRTPIPPEITTPDEVVTRLGTLRHDDGVPTAETAELLFDHLDLLRGVEAFLQCVPAASLEAMRVGMESLGVQACHQIVLMEQLLDSGPLFLTGNTDTVYASGVLDLERDGPTVVEIPPGCGPGTVNDAWFRFVVDMGAPGPDRGQGGTYLIVPTGWQGTAPDDWFVAETPSRISWLILRGMLVDGAPDAAVRTFREGLRVYPLSAAGDPPALEVISGSGRSYNTVHANDERFFDELAAVVQREPVDVIDPETRGLLAAIGITKDEPFAPDERRRALLREAAAIANSTARTLVFHSRDPEARIYDDRQWMTAFIGGDHRWLHGDGRRGRDLDARTMFFYMATVNTPAMALAMPGLGSQYAWTAHDAAGDPLDGGRRYRLDLPPDLPAADFCSVTVYDPQTRSELQTSQPYPSWSSQRDPGAVAADGSVQLHFGPEPPAQGSDGWIQTVPGKGWFAILRLYGPLEPWFDGSWVPGDLQPV